MGAHPNAIPSIGSCGTCVSMWLHHWLARPPVAGYWTAPVGVNVLNQLHQQLETEDLIETIESFSCGASAMWTCPAARCSPTSPAVAARDARPLFRVDDVPTTANSPLFIHCSSCSSRLVPCECCHALLLAERAVDGVVVCTRCGFLTVLDATLRELFQQPAFSRAILAFIAPVLMPMERLDLQWTQWKQRAAQWQPTEEDDDATLSSPSSSKKRPRTEAMAAQSSMHSPPSGSLKPGDLPTDLRAEGKQIRSAMHSMKKQWRAILAQAEAEALQRDVNSPQLFSTTHHAILRAMYEKTMDKDEFAACSAQIDSFLLQQSTLVNAQCDLLQGLRSCLQVQELPAITGGSTRGTAAIVRLAKQQARHQHEQFDQLASQHLRVVGIANKHLFALYSAAQGLAKLQVAEGTDSSSDRQRYGAFGSPNTSSPASILTSESTRPRRLFELNASSIGVPLRHDTAQVSNVQRAIEMRHRVAEISKKVELWRSLSYTISSTCVVGLLELARMNCGLKVDHQ